MATYNLNGVSKTMTTQEENDYISLQSNLELEALQKELRTLRDAELRKTDVWVLKGTITDAQRTYRENLRTAPQDFTTVNQIKTVLALDKNNNLTHSIWTQPTE